MFSTECECNPEGANKTSCDVISGQCSCNNGWEGKRCEINQGKPNQWQFFKINNNQCCIDDFHFMKQK